MKSLYDEIKKYSEEDILPLHMPGHKRKASGVTDDDLFKIDLTEVEGTDDLHDPHGIILEAEKKAAAILGSDESFFLVNGSSGGVLAAISACVKKGGKIIIVRNAHRSAYNAMYLRDIDPVYVFPQNTYDGLSVDVANADEIRKALEENPGVEAVFIVSPTYEGRLADIKSIAEAVHEKGIPLIVDEAHGAHLSFVENSIADASRCGADIVIQSVHKTLPAPTQAAILSVNGSLVNREELKRFLSVYQSSSPSYPLMAMTDSCLRYMEERSGELIPSFKNRFEDLLKKLEECKKLSFSPSVSELREEKADYGKLLIKTGKCDIDAVRLAEIMRKEYKIETEMTSPGFVLAMFTVCDDDAAYDRTAEALIRIDKTIGSSDERRDDILTGIQPVRRMSISDALDSESSVTEIESAEGCISSALVCLYPPGTPLLVPGEEITPGHISVLKKCLVKGYNINGISENGISVVGTIG